LVKISIIGVGPGSPDYVTPIAKRTVRNAQLVIGAERALNLFRGDTKGETLALTAKNMNEALRRAVESAAEGKTVALLSTGDPGFSGLLRTFQSATEGKEVDIDVVPGISSMQACAARLQICWDETKLFSFHEGTSLEKREELADAVKKGNSVMLFPDPKTFTPQSIARFLIENGVAEETAVAVCENLTLDNERIVASTLRGILGKRFGSLSVMVIRPS
jgi:cobalt-precorrin-7 (C5)-methyltransferase